jgi:MFS family permease
MAGSQREGPSAQPTGLGAGYWKLISASLASNLADGIGLVAYPWLAASLTRDPVLVAGIGAASQLPWLLLSLPVGALVDRRDRLRLMLWANLLRAALAALVALAIVSDALWLPLLYAAAFAMGGAEVVKDNAAQAILPRLVGADQLERANGNLWAAQGLMNQAVGPWLGGTLLAAAAALPFLVEAGLFGVGAGLVALLAGGGAAPAAAAAGGRPLRQEVTEGLRWLWDHELLRTLALFVGALNLVAGVALATVVLFAQDVLGLDADGFGLLVAAAAAGGLLGSLVAPWLSRTLGVGPTIWLCPIGSAVGLSVVGLTSSARLAAAMLALDACLAVVWNVVTVSLRQRIIPNRLLGRVNSVYRLLAWGTLPLGSLLGGALVALGGAVAGREAALRGPFLVAAAVNLVLFPLVVGRLSTARIEAVHQAAGPQPGA